MAASDEPLLIWTAVGDMAGMATSKIGTGGLRCSMGRWEERVCQGTLANWQGASDTKRKAKEKEIDINQDEVVRCTEKRRWEVES